jgi:hypothetical protein
VKNELKLSLEECGKEYFGDKLVLHFGDSFLHAASIIRKN